MPHPTPTWLKNHEIQKKQHLSPQTEFKKGCKPANTGKRKRIIALCKFCGKSLELYPWRAKKYKTVFCSANCKNLWMKGSNNPFWKGGYKNSESYLSRLKFRKEYEKWRMKVLVRGNFTCVKCNQEGMEAHHIKKWKDFPELRFDVNNGECLCKKHHNETKNFKKQ